MKIIRQGVFKHYRRQPDGSLKFLGDVTYSYTDTVTSAERWATRRDAAFCKELLSVRNACDFARREAACEAFEDLVNRANETEA